jgi:CHAT domain-containing protein/tetratricopeptide (TPR) repeat protein
MTPTCLSESQLLLLALGDRTGRDGAATEHAATCASCQARIDSLRQAAAGIATTDSGVPAGGCLDDLGLAELLEGSASSGAIAHVAACGACRRTLASAAALLADPLVAGELGAVRVADRRRWPMGRVALGIASAAACVALVTLTQRHRYASQGDDHRGPTITAATAPAPMSPVGDVVEATSLRWRAVSGADQYHVTLFDATGKALYEAQVSDTVVAVPDSIVLDKGRSYLWKVEARTAWDRWVSSDLIEFRLSPGSGPLTIKPGPSIYMLASQPAPQDSLRLIAPRLSDSALVVEARSRPLELRDALSATLARSVRGDPIARDAEVVTARRLAAAHAAAWQDEFFVREVARFVAWEPGQRAAKVAADSLRRAGIAAFDRDGAGAAVAIWRRALARSTAINDTAGMAAALGNIGSGFAWNDGLDSAESYLGRSRTLALNVGDIRVAANAFDGLADLRARRNDVAGAREQYARAIVLRGRIGDTRGLAADYNNLAGLAREAGDFDEARRQLEAALALNRGDGRDDKAATNLVNLAGLASLYGDFTRAETLYREALGVWRARQQWPNVADAMRGLGSLELRRGEYRTARRDFQDALAIYDRTGPATDALAMREQLAATLAAEGNLQGALDALRLAQRVADSSHLSPSSSTGITLARADLAVRLNTLPDAERLYAGAVMSYRRSGDRAGEAAAQHGLGVLLLAQEKSASAGPPLEAALRTQLAIGDQRGASVTRLSLADYALQRGDTTGARRQLARASSDLARLGDPVAAAAAIGERATLEAGAGLSAMAESLFRKALATAGDRLAPEVTWRLHAGLGMTRREQGGMDEAAREFRTAIADIERAGRSLTLAERRSNFLADKWDVYLDLALLERTRGRGDAAFAVSERLRATEMLEMLSQGRVASVSEAAPDLIVREQDLRRRIAELTRGVETGPSTTQPVRGPDVTRASAVTREALLRAQTAYADLLLEIRERAPRHAELVSRATVTWQNVSRRLRPSEAFIEYLVSDANAVAFVMTRDTMVTVNLPAERRELARLIDFVRGTLQPRGSPRLDSLWRAPLRQLHRDLIGPIEATGLLAGKTRLIVVPHAELHYLPFAALVEDGPARRFLIERYDVSVTPSASVWLALGERPRSATATGTLAFAPRPDALPASREEVAAIAHLGGTAAHAVVGSEATEAAFRRDAPSRRVIHLATYGVLNKQNPLFSFVELTPGAGEDGHLEAHEVFGLHLTADLVVLSACQTALASGTLSDVPAGDDWVGLVRAFLSAGAARVMATLWPVQDRATATLMEKFYARYPAGSDPARALAEAQRSLLAVPATASPYYWAGFEVVGGR